MVPVSDVGVLIAGAGAAGSACAEALRDLGYDGSVILAGRDVDPPYERPYCSKSYLRAQMSREETYVPVPDDVDLRIRTSVMKLDPGARTAKLSSGDELSFEHAVLATGANVKRLRVDGCDLDGIHYLRTLGNSDSIRADAAAAENVVLIGGSYIACEVAASLTAEGKHCTLVMPEAGPLSLGFGPIAAEFFQGVLRDHGIDWVANDGLARFEGDGRVGRVVTESGRELPADVVVMGIGVVPDVMLARSAGGWSTGSTRGRRAPRWRARSRARSARTTRSPISGRTSPIGARSSTSARPTPGTARRSAARSTTASSRSSISTASDSWRR
jgi:3-phenylpropionate/trans-cinnamate dioxygenase ferredoxin reductase subunit